MATNPPTGLDILERLVRRAGFDEVEERTFLDTIANERDPAKANATAEVRAAEAAFDAAVITRDSAKITQAAQNLDKAKAAAAAAASGAPSTDAVNAANAAAANAAAVAAASPTPANNAAAANAVAAANAAAAGAPPSNVVPLAPSVPSAFPSTTSTIKAAAVASATANYNAALAEVPPDPAKVAAMAEALETAQGLPE